MGSPLTLGDQNIQADLDFIITHEAGHFLGLSHSCRPDATMLATYTLGDTNLRTLRSDDVAGICEIYPPGGATEMCDPTPRHGFSADCGTDAQDRGCCATAPGRSDTDGTWSILALLAGAGALAHRRRSPRQ